MKRPISPHAPRPSLRSRLTWSFTALALIVAIAQATLIWFTGNRAEEAMIDNIAAEQLRMSITQYRRDPVLAQPNTPDMRLYVANDGDRSALPAYLRALPLTEGAYEVFPGAGIEYHVAMAPDDGRWFYLAYDVAEHEHRERNVIMMLAISVAMIASIMLAASSWLARRLTSDLDRLSLAVRDETAAAHGGGLAELAHHAESAELAQALDDQRRRLDAALARERAFSAAASHELRTPLMRAASTLELLRASALDERQRTRVDQLGASLTEITMLTAGLLRVARGKMRESRTPLDLPALASEVVAHLEPEARARSIAVSMEILPGASAAGDRDALWIVLVNLLRNAIRHSGGTRVRVGWRDGILTVADNGLGFDAAHGADLHRPDANSGDEDGFGLGLSIVERICEVADWRLTIDSAPGRGARIGLVIAQACVPDNRLPA